LTAVPRRTGPPKQDSTKSTDANSTKTWLLFGDPGSYRVASRYGKYEWCMQVYGVCETGWEPMRHTGGVGHNNLDSRPNFKSDEFRHDA